MNARMETASRLIHRARNAGGSLALHGGKVKALAVPAELLPELRAHKAEIVRLLTPAADAVGIADAMPAAEGVTPAADTPPLKPIARAVLRFTLREGGGTVLGQPSDTPDSLLADLRERWPGELMAVWSGDEQMYP